jgi:hypothetical protein
MFEFIFTRKRTTHFGRLHDETGQATNATGAQATGGCD